jgi:iron complex transport system substrate-binding protein
MKICSLLPSSTEILYLLDLKDQVVAVTHECDYPPEAMSKPQITESLIDDQGLTSMEIDHRVSSNIGRHGSIYRLKQDMLDTLKPDLIVTQELCEVCAVSYSEVQRAVKVLEGPSRIVSLEPTTLDEVLGTILRVGQITDRGTLAEIKFRELRDRLDRVRDLVKNEPRPRVYSMEWLDPPYSAGHWVPEMVAIGGGQEVLGRHARKSVRLTSEQVIEARPDVIVLMPCGFSLERTIEEYHRTPRFPGWNDIPAVRAGQVYAVNGSAYFNRSGPRLVDGVEILAEILHPYCCRSLAPSNSYRRITER